MDAHTITQQLCVESPRLVAFLPLGADLNTAVYRVVTQTMKRHTSEVETRRFDEIP
jgi:hypothetical protein